MEIKTCGSTATRRASAEWFTGTVWQEPIVEAAAPARIRATLVRFDPGARTNWHTHPLGQTLYVLAGSGLAQSEGGPVRQIRAGDVIWISPGEKHWHGAGPGNAMTHVAMQEALDGKAVEWLERVEDEQYSAS
jgi:quercetin dioxygenase-like cupin family protein